MGRRGRKRKVKKGKNSGQKRLSLLGAGGRFWWEWSDIYWLEITLESLIPISLRESKTLYN